MMASLTDMEVEEDVHINPRQARPLSYGSTGTRFVQIQEQMDLSAKQRLAIT